MPREFSRARRIAAQLRRGLAELIALEVKDPRLRGVVISDVELSRDLSFAKVFVTLPADSDHPVQLAALRGAGGHLRSELAKRMRTRTLPRLDFRYDETLDNAARIEALLRAGGKPVSEVPEDEGPDGDR